MSNPMFEVRKDDCLMHPWKGRDSRGLGLTAKHPALG